VDIKEDIQDWFKDTYKNSFFRYNNFNNNDSNLHENHIKIKFNVDIMVKKILCIK